MAGRTCTFQSFFLQDVLPNWVRGWPASLALGVSILLLTGCLAEYSHRVSACVTIGVSILLLTGCLAEFGRTGHNRPQESVSILLLTGCLAESTPTRCTSATSTRFNPSSYRMSCRMSMVSPASLTESSFNPSSYRMSCRILRRRLNRVAGHGFQSFFLQDVLPNGLGFADEFSPLTSFQSFFLQDVLPNLLASSAPLLQKQVSILLLTGCLAEFLYNTR